MIKIINRKKYDTSTAKSVASADNKYPDNDFRYQEEILYQTENGTWFLHGKGGPLSDYAEHRGNHRTEGEDLRPMSPSEAYAWLEANQKTEAIELHFQEHIQNA